MLFLHETSKVKRTDKTMHVINTIYIPLIQMATRIWNLCVSCLLCRRSAVSSSSTREVEGWCQQVHYLNV